MSMMPTWRDSRCSSLASICASASFGSTPFASRSSPRGPNSTMVEACVQTAPTPARACGTARPTNGTRVVTAAPDCPVTGSIAQIEKVEYCGSPSSLSATPSAARCCAKALDETIRTAPITDEINRIGEMLTPCVWSRTGQECSHRDTETSLWVSVANNRGVDGSVILSADAEQDVWKPRMSDVALVRETGLPHHVLRSGIGGGGDRND